MRRHSRSITHWNLFKGVDEWWIHYPGESESTVEFDSWQDGIDFINRAMRAYNFIAKQAGLS